MPAWFDLDTLLANEIVQAILTALAVAAVMFVVVKVARRLVLKYVDDPERQYHANKTIGRIGGFVFLLLIVGLLSPSPGEVLTLLTVVGAGLAIAMRETLLSFFGWLHITVRVPFRQGDRIEVHGVRGDVVDIRLLHTTLMEIGGWVDADQSTGRLVHLPNNWIFLHGVYNYTRGFHFIWNEIPVTVTFRSDWEAAREIMLELADESAAIVERQARGEIKQMAREYLIYYNILTPFVYVHLAENGVRLTLRYLCEVRKRRGTAHALTMGMLARFKAHGGIELAYPAAAVTIHETPQFGPMPEGAAPPPRRAGRDGA